MKGKERESRQKEGAGGWDEDRPSPTRPLVYIIKWPNRSAMS